MKYFNKLTQEVKTRKNFGRNEICLVEIGQQLNSLQSQAKCEDKFGFLDEPVLKFCPSGTEIPPKWD